MRATKTRRYKNSENLVNSVSNSSKPRYNVSKSNRKTKKKFRFLSVALGVAAAAVTLIIPTTTLAPDVNAFADTKAAAYSIGDIDKFAIVVTDNCITETTIPETEAVETTVKVTQVTTEPTTKATEPETTEPTTEPATKATEPATKATEPAETQAPATTPTAATAAPASSGYLIGISNPDYSYSPKPVSLSDYDRAKLERLVMGEAGSLGYNGAALVAQSIRDAMNLSGTSSIDRIISEYQYYAPTNKEPSQTVKNAVSYIFDSNGSAVQHRILCFYTGVSDWHESQEFIVGCGNVRFFDYN